MGQVIQNSIYLSSYLPVFLSSCVPVFLSSCLSVSLLKLSHQRLGPLAVGVAGATG